MDRFRIKYFKRAFALGSVERFCMECLKPILAQIQSKSASKSVPKSVSVEKLSAIVSDDIFPKLGIQKDDQAREDVKWELLALADYEIGQDSARLMTETEVDIERFLDLMHRFFYNQLRVEAKVNPELEEMLYKDAVILGEADQDHSDTATHQKLFESLDADKIAIRDNGTIKLERGAIVSKKFKYVNASGEEIKVEILSNTPAVVQIRSPVISIEGNGSEVVKFIIQAPNTACYVESKILIINQKTRQPEELIIFTVDID